MSLPPERIVPDQQMFAEALGIAPARGRLRGRRILVVGAGSAPRSTSIRRSATAATSRCCARARARASPASTSRAKPPSKPATNPRRRRPGLRRNRRRRRRRRDRAAGRALGRRLGGLDGLVMVVGVTKALPLAKQDARGWDHEFAVNVRSNMLFAQKALELMDDGASMVLMSSLAALRNSSGMPGYETSKAAQVALARSIAMAGQAKGKRCKPVLPGLMDTPMGRDATRGRAARVGMPLPFGRQGTGWEVAYATLFLLSNESSYVNAHALVVDGGIVGGIARAPR